MPPKKNKPGNNGFYYFMQDFKQKQGRHLNNMKEVAEAAGPHWARMSKEQKRPYEEKARMEKNSMRPGKFTSDGQSVEELERQERFRQSKIQEMKDDINYNLKVAYDTRRIQDELFFIVHVNYFCHFVAQDRYYAAELAVCCFSLEDGVLPQNVFHRIIKPGPLPLGYASEAKLLSDKSHQLPPPLAGDYDNNLDEVYTELKMFLSTKLSGSKRYPPLYTSDKMINMTQNILDTLCEDHEDRPLFKVYNLEYMFKVLKNMVSGETVWPTDTYSHREIEKDLFAFAVGISCEFHSVTEVPIHCSRSIVVRYAYVICDNCCSSLKITLVPGTHIPDAALTPFIGTRSSSRASLASGSSQSNKFKPSIRDDDSDSVISVSSKSEWDNQSIVSDTSNSTFDADFPVFKKKSASSNSQPLFTSLDSRSLSRSSGRSYAGAMGPSGLSRRQADAPSDISSDLDDLASNDSVTDFYTDRERAFDSGNDFPALGSGRGRVLGRGRRFN